MLLLGAAPPGASAQGTASVHVAADTDAAKSPRLPESLNRPVTLSLNNVPLADAIQAIDRQANLQLEYTEQILPAEFRVTIAVKKVTAGDALGRILTGTGVVVRVGKTGHLILAHENAPKRAEGQGEGDGSLFGRVTDSVSAEPLKGALISVKGTSLSTLSNSEGGFLLAHVPVGMRRMTVRVLGYEAAERDVAVMDSQTTRIDVAMRIGISQLQEVVTTASRPQRRLEIGSDITVINADSVVATQPINSVIDLLEGRVPGLEVQHTSGAPGDPSRLRLRGTSSTYLNNDPIFIVDGVRIYSAQSDPRSTNLASTLTPAPSPIDYLDPHSIASVEVFKGPSAATLYGADAANGVIVITTKKGQVGPPRWTGGVEYAVTALPGSYPDSYLSWGHLPWDGTPMLCPVSATNCLVDSVSKFQALNDPSTTILGHGNRRDENVGVSGGSDALQYSLTANEADEMGFLHLPGIEVDRYTASHGSGPPDWMVHPDQLNQWSVTSRMTMKLGSKANVSITSMLSRTHQQKSSLDGDILTLEQTYLNKITGLYYQTGGGVLTPATALLSDYYTKLTDQATNFTTGASLTYRPLGWLTTSADVGINVIQREDESLLPRGAAPTTDSIGAASEGRGSSLVNTVNLRATATAPLPAGMKLQTSLGANYTATTTSDLAITVNNLASGSISVGDAGMIQSVTQDDQSVATYGWYLEPTVSAKDLWITAGFRMDGSNTYGSNASLALLPKVNVSWLLSDEPFFPWKSLFRELRLRTAYGLAGVQPGPADRLRLYSSGQQTWLDGQYVNGTTLATLGNTQLKAETSREIEGGFDAVILDDRFALSATAYNKTRFNALMQFPLPPSVDGALLPILKNIGEIRNSGYELSLTTQLLRGDAVSWSAQVSVSHNRNVVVSLGPGVTPFGPTISRVVPGYPLGGRWGIPVIGYTDLNHDGKIAPNEVLYGDSAVYLGSADPDYIGDLHTTVSLFRGTVAITASFSYQGGFTQVGPFSSLRTVSRGFNDPSAPLGQQAAAVSGQYSDFLNAQTVSTIRFSSLSVAVNLPQTFAQRLGARSMAVAFQGTNLALFSNYRGLDPGVNSFGTGNQVADAGTVPLPRSFQVRISATY
jgi:TonB-linked SusC/RagA family outer membrane protein